MYLSKKQANNLLTCYLSQNNPLFDILSDETTWNKKKIIENENDELIAAYSTKDQTMANIVISNKYIPINNKKIATNYNKIVANSIKYPCRKFVFH